MGCCHAGAGMLHIKSDGFLWALASKCGCALGLKWSHGQGAMSASGSGPCLLPTALGGGGAGTQKCVDETWPEEKFVLR